VDRIPGILRTAEIYDPTMQTFTCVHAMSCRHPLSTKPPTIHFLPEAQPGPRAVWPRKGAVNLEEYRNRWDLILAALT
jgi:hypothetical protein